MNVAKFFRVRQQKKDVGVEIEVEGDNLYKGNLDHWKVEHDGSLRGLDNAEYVLREPLYEKGLKLALLNLKKMLKRSHATVDMSRRTSTHVHINCTQLTMRELFNFITLLLIFEELLVDWCGEGRNGNFFCLQSKDADGMLESLRKFAKRGERAHLQDNIRYSAINLAALCKYGSVELRSLEGTLDHERVLTWVAVLLRIREEAKKFANPMDIISHMSLEEPVAFSKRILGEHTKEFFIGKNRSRKVLDGARRAQDIAYTVNWERYDKEDEEQKGWPEREAEAIERMRVQLDADNVPEGARMVPPRPQFAQEFQVEPVPEEVPAQAIDIEAINAIFGAEE